VAASIQVKIDGLKPVLKRLNKVAKPRRRAAILAQSLNAGLAPLKTAFRRQIRRQGAVRKGHLLKAVVSKVKGYPSGNAVLMVGVRDKKSGDGENPGKYFHLVDLGTKSHELPGRPARMNGQWILVPGRWQHPGAKSKPIREPATNAVTSEKISDKIMVRLEKLLTKELSTGG